MSPQYDSVEGIDAYLADLAGLHRLNEDRRAARERGEHLNSFIVLGRYLLDECANFMTIFEWRDPNHNDASWVGRAILPVVSMEWLRSFPDLWITSMHLAIPRAEDSCIECGVGWTIADADDCEMLRWNGPPEPRRLGHKDCLRLKAHREEEACFRAIVEEAGLVKATMVAVPNGYGMKDGPPWFDLRTRHGEIVIGWRKRVISIEWGDVVKRAQARVAVQCSGDRCDRHEAKAKVRGQLSAEMLFPKEETTKDGALIHAWGHAKAVEYLRTLHAAFESVFALGERRSEA